MDPSSLEAHDIGDVLHDPEEETSSSSASYMAQTDYMSEETKQSTMASQRTISSHPVYHQRAQFS